jgi:hypothetical protein
LKNSGVVTEGITLNKGMAESEDIRARIRKINPQALEIFDEFDKQLAKLGGG